jgi:hypothetical protein
MRRALMMPAAMAAAALLAAVPASAAVITYKSWYSAANGPDPASTPQAYTQTDWTGVSQKIRVPQFDTSLGTLTAATLSLYADANSTGSVQNTGTTTATIKSYTANLRVRLLTPSSSTSGPGIDSPATLSTPYLLEALPPLITVTNRSLAPNATLPFSLTGTNNTTGTLDLFASSGLLPFFEGTGQATLPVYTNTRTISSVTGGNLIVNQNTQARAEAVVAYTYTAAPQPPLPPPVPVPEPRSAALLGASLLDLGFLRRRR